MVVILLKSPLKEIVSLLSDLQHQLICTRLNYNLIFHQQLNNWPLEQFNWKTIPKQKKILSCIPSFEEFTKAISDHEKKNQEEKAAELDQPTWNLGGKLTPRFSSESLLNFMHEFATQQEISKMLQGTSYEEAFTDREIEK